MSTDTAPAQLPQLSATPDAAPVFSYALPHAELPVLVGLLRALGLELVDAAMKRRQPRLLPWLYRQHLSALYLPGRYPHYTFGHTVRSAMRGDLMPAAHRRDDPAHSLQVGGQVDVGRWHSRVMAEIATRVQAEPHYAVPPALWRLAGLHAWDATPYRTAIGRLVQQQLYGWAFVDSSAPQPVFLHGQTLWYLLALAARNTLYDRRNLFWHLAPDVRPRLRRIQPAVHWFTRFERLRPRAERWSAWLEGDPVPTDTTLRDWWRLRAVLGMLAQQARHHALLEEGWATVWDQWLLLEAFTHWQRGLWPSVLTAPLRELPLREKRRYQAEHAFVAENWHANSPAWFLTWFEQSAPHTPTPAEHHAPADTA